MRFYWIIALGALSWLLAQSSLTFAEKPQPAVFDSVSITAVIKEYQEAAPGSPERKELLKHIGDFQRPHSFWYALHQHPYLGSELRLLSLEKMELEATTNEELWENFQAISSDPKRLKKNFRALLDSANTCQRAFRIYRNFYKIEGFEPKARKVLMKTDCAFEQWLAIYLFADQMSALERDVLDRIKKTEAPVEKWIAANFLAQPKSRLWWLAIDRMADTILNFEHAHIFWGRAEYSRLEEQGLKIMFHFAETFEQRLIVLDCSTADSDIEKRVFVQLLDAADSEEKLKELSRHVPAGLRYDVLIQKKLAEVKK